MATKLVETGSAARPAVEGQSLRARSHARALEVRGASTTLRLTPAGAPFVTDSGKHPRRQLRCRCRHRRAGGSHQAVVAWSRAVWCVAAPIRCFLSDRAGVHRLDSPRPIVAPADPGRHGCYGHRQDDHRAGLGGRGSAALSVGRRRSILRRTSPSSAGHRVDRRHRHLARAPSQPGSDTHAPSGTGHYYLLRQAASRPGHRPATGRGALVYLRMRPRPDRRSARGSPRPFHAHGLLQSQIDTSKTVPEEIPLTIDSCRRAELSPRRSSRPARAAPRGPGAMRALER